jgi:hypothetical protein
MHFTPTHRNPLEPATNNNAINPSGERAELIGPAALRRPVIASVILTTQRKHSPHSLLPHRFGFRLAPTVLLGRIPRASEPSWRRMVSSPRRTPASSNQLCGSPVLVGKTLSRKATLSGDEPQNSQNNKAVNPKPLVWLLNLKT